MCPLDQLVGGFKEIITGYFTVYENLTLGKLIKFRSANVDTEKLARVALKHELHKFLCHKIALLPTMEFGIKISNRLAQDEARVVPAPWLKYHESGRETECLPKVGQWNMRNKRMVNGGIVKCTICINFARNAQDNAARGFCRELAQTCNISGMTFSTEPILSVVTYPPEQVERVLKTADHNLMEKLPPHRKNQDLLIVILLDINESPYGETETPPCGYGDGGESIIIVWDEDEGVITSWG